MKKVFIMGCIIFSLCLGSWWIFSDKVIDPNTLFVFKSNVNQKVIVFSIASTDSATIIKKYNWEYKNNSLFIKIKGSALTLNKSGIDKITIKNRFKNLKEIYITNGSKYKKIWDEGLASQE